MKIRIVNLVFLGMCLCPVLAFSQVKAKSKVLQEMVAQLPDIKLDQGAEGEFKLTSIVPSKPIVVTRDKEGIIDHVGVKMFDRAILSLHPSHVYCFLERYLLELLLLPNQEEITWKLRMDKVKFTSDVYKMTDYKKAIRQFIAAYAPDCSIYITCNNNRYMASCIRENKVLLKMVFPVNHELITGLSKLEAENSVYLSLLAHRVEKPGALSLNDVSVYQDSLYAYNEDYYMMEDIISTSYYRAEKENLVPLFEEEAMPESVYNLFNAEHDWGVEVEITQSLYGGKKQTYSLPLYHLLDYLRKQGCGLYTGLKKVGSSSIEGTVLAVHMELGYQHWLSFKVDRKVIRHPDKAEVKVKMYSYIPIHNVSSLFGN